MGKNVERSKNQSTRKPASRYLLPITGEQYPENLNINKICTMTAPVDMPLWMREISQSLLD